jgi:hypothetical protein
MSSPNLIVSFMAPVMLWVTVWWCATTREVHPMPGDFLYERVVDVMVGRPYIVLYAEVIRVSCLLMSWVVCGIRLKAYRRDGRIFAVLIHHF